MVLERFPLAAHSRDEDITLETNVAGNIASDIENDKASLLLSCVD